MGEIKPGQVLWFRDVYHTLGQSCHVTVLDVTDADVKMAVWGLDFKVITLSQYVIQAKLKDGSLRHRTDQILASTTEDGESVLVDEVHIYQEEYGEEFSKTYPIGTVQERNERIKKDLRGEGIKVRGVETYVRSDAAYVDHAVFEALKAEVEQEKHEAMKAQRKAMAATKRKQDLARLNRLQAEYGLPLTETL